MHPKQRPFRNIGGDLSSVCWLVLSKSICIVATYWVGVWIWAHINLAFCAINPLYLNVAYLHTVGTLRVLPEWEK